MVTTPCDVRDSKIFVEKFYSVETQNNALICNSWETKTATLLQAFSS